MDNYLQAIHSQLKFTRKPSVLELSKAFPDCRDIARRNMDELIEKTKEWIDIIKKEPLAVHFMSIDPDIKKINALQKFLNLTSPISNNKIDISKAKAFPIQDIFDFQKVRKSSKRIQCSCPLHKDDSPSLVLYLDSNSAHCFSCNRSFDSIDLSMAINQESFINAVRRLSK